jgi:tryptophan-rich sensory protein
MDYKKLAISLAIPLLAGIIGSLATQETLSSWYSTLEKPVFNPPNWVFGPVWTALYLLMGITLYLLWTSKNKNKRTAIKWFSIQLALNAIWSPLFFGLHSILLAFIDISLLWLTLVINIITTLKVSKKAAYLLVPYLLWVTFALVLNATLLVIN